MLVALFNIQMGSPLARSSIAGCPDWYLSGSGSARNGANPLGMAETIHSAEEADLLQIVQIRFPPPSQIMILKTDASDLPLFRVRHRNWLMVLSHNLNDVRFIDV